MDKKINPSSILDIGCGQGACADQIDLNVCAYTGIDPSPFLLERAKQLHHKKPARFVLGNAYMIPFDNNHFDAAFSIAVWHLLENKEQASQELSRIIKNDGSFLIVAANPESYDEWTRTYETSKRFGVRFEGTNRLASGSESTDVLFLHSFEEIVGHLNTANLRVEQTKAFRTALAIQGRKVVR